MSSLWTPGGEVPVDRNRPTGPDADPKAAPGPAGDGPAGPVDEGAARAQYEAMRAQLLEIPAADVIAQELVAIYELAVLHLSQEEPKLDQARLAIDTLAAVVDAVGDRLGPAGEQFAEIVPQLRLAYVERSGG